MTTTNKNSHNNSRNILYFASSIMFIFLSILASGVAICSQLERDESACDYNFIKISMYLYDRCNLVSEAGHLSELTFIGTFVVFVVLPFVMLVLIYILNRKNLLFTKVLDGNFINEKFLFLSIIVCLSLVFTIFLADISDPIFRRYTVIFYFPGMLIFNTFSALFFSLFACTPFILAMKKLSGEDDV